MTEPDSARRRLPALADVIGEPAEPVAIDEHEIDHPHPRRDTGADEVRYEVADYDDADVDEAEARKVDPYTTTERDEAEAAEHLERRAAARAELNAEVRARLIDRARSWITTDVDWSDGERVAAYVGRGRYFVAELVGSARAGRAMTGVIATPPPAAAAELVSRRELLGLVRELRLLDDRTPAAAREALLARKRAMIERLDPDFYDLEIYGLYGPDDVDDAAAVAAWELETDLDASDLLETLVAGGTHPSVEPRPAPNTPEWAALSEQLQGRHDAAVQAIDELELDCAVYNMSFPDTLREVLEAVARRRGGSEALVETRPGSWEADHIRGLVAMVDYELDRDLDRHAGDVDVGAPGAGR